MLSHSIIILTKDRPTLLPRAVASAWQAIGPDGEILVIDDASATPATEVLGPASDTRLRVLRREASSGISAARNAGIAASRGAVIFFLDDDDELEPDYIRAILSGPAQKADYGFSVCATIATEGRVKPDRPRFPTGLIPPAAPLRKKLCGTGMGFWIHREIAEATGPFETAIHINEDTDYVCRLILQKRRAWYSARPGVTVHRHMGAGNLSNITSRLKAAERAQAMLHVCERYPSLAAHLGRSYLRHCAKANLSAESQRYLKGRPVFARLSLSCYYHTKRLVYRLRRAARPEA